MNEEYFKHNLKKDQLLKSNDNSMDNITSKISTIAYDSHMHTPLSMSNLNSNINSNNISYENIKQTSVNTSNNVKSPFRQRSAENSNINVVSKNIENNLKKYDQH